jgi:hypothetical protein
MIIPSYIEHGTGNIIIIIQRSDGARGASIETLRGTTGADFEGNGTITRVSADGRLLGCFCCIGSSRDKYKNKERILLIKGPFCFVFNIDDTTSPKYAVGLHNIQPVIKDSSRTTVVLETVLGVDTTNFEIHLKDSETATKFAKVVSEQSSTAQSDEVRKHLGHENLLHKRSSIAYAETIAIKKFINEQPSEPITTKEIFDNMPQPGGM